MRFDRITRRGALKAAGAGFGALAAAQLYAADEPRKANGNIKQSVCAWCYKMTPEKLAEEAKPIGYQSVELLGYEDIKKVKAVGLTCAVMRSACPIHDGLNRKDNHDKIVKQLEADIEFAVAENIPNVLCMSGNRKGMADDEGMENCATGLKRVMKFAEEKKITVLMEGLNSKVNHKDYMADHTAWGAAVMHEVNSPHVKLLYDIYHMQIMEGDLIATITANIGVLGHFHTGGVPGRHQLDHNQEIQYDAVMKGIADAGYQGYVAHEFLPTIDPVTALRQAVTLCAV
jgi:hydroxypyruvate isomerase